MRDAKLWGEDSAPLSRLREAKRARGRRYRSAGVRGALARRRGCKHAVPARREPAALRARRGADRRTDPIRRNRARRAPARRARSRQGARRQPPGGARGDDRARSRRARRGPHRLRRLCAHQAPAARLALNAGDSPERHPRRAHADRRRDRRARRASEPRRGRSRRSPQPWRPCVATTTRGGDWRSADLAFHLAGRRSPQATPRSQASSSSLAGAIWSGVRRCCRSACGWNKLARHARRSEAGVGSDRRPKRQSSAQGDARTPSQVLDVMMRDEDIGMTGAGAAAGPGRTTPPIRRARPFSYNHCKT